MAWWRVVSKVQDLIKDEIDEFKDWNAKGNFMLVLCVPAKKLESPAEQKKLSESKEQVEPPMPSVVMISSDLKKPIKDKFVTIAGKGARAMLEMDPLEITGTYASDKKTKTYTFMYDDASKAKAENMHFLQDTYLVLALWQFMPPGTTAVYWQGTEPPKNPALALIEAPAFDDTVKDLTCWDLRFLLRWIAKNEDKEQQPPMVETVERAGGRHRWPFKRINLPPIEIVPHVRGPIAIALMGDPTLHQMFYDAGWDAAKKYAKTLKKKLDDIDEQLLAGGKKLSPQQADVQVKKALTEFQTELLTKCAADVGAIWLEYTKSHAQYRNYKIIAGFKLASQISGLVVGLTTTILAGWTGIGTVLGACATAKSAMELGRNVAMLAIDVDNLGTKLGKNMRELQDRVAKETPNMTGAKEVRDEAIAKLTGYKKTSIATFKTDHKQYKEKINGCLAKSHDVSGKLNKTLDETAKAQTEMEAKVESAWKQACEALTEAKVAAAVNPKQKLDPRSPDTKKTIDLMTDALKKITTPEGKEVYISWKLLGGLQKKLTKAQKNLDGTLTFISDTMGKYGENKKNAELMGTWLKQLEETKQVPDWAEKVNTYVLPFLDLAFDPSVDTVKSVVEGIVIEKVGEKVVGKLDDRAAAKDQKWWDEFSAEAAKDIAGNDGAAIADIIKKIKSGK